MDTAEEFKEILLRTFADFIRYCDEKGYRWFLSFGAAIGAVRHGGMIPWDDDIDVYMPREDYMRFISETGRIKCLEGEYEILHLSKSDRDLSFPIAKFCDYNSTIWEKETYPFTEGVFIDVFPLDATSGTAAEVQADYKKYKRAFLNYKRSFRGCSLNTFVEALKNGDFHKAGAMVLDRFWYRPRKKTCLRRFLELDSAFSKRDGDNVVAFGTHAPATLHPKALFDGYELVDFEGMKVRVPLDNSLILTQLYGDFMKLPPERERISNHSRYFMDLHRRLSVEQIREIHS